METSTIEYLKAQVVSAIPTTTGEITTTTVITFANGVTVEGTAIRDVNSYDKDESDTAAFHDAIASLAPGVEFILKKAE